MASESETAPPPVDVPEAEETEETVTEDVTPKVDEPPTEESELPASDPAVDPLEAPLPAELTTKELIAKRKEEKGVVYACCFAFCCCPLCYEKMEYILDYLCCRTCGSA